MRIIESKYKICRRYGINFYNCKISKSKLSQLPGDIRSFRGQPSTYKQQLQEKQKLFYFYYGITNLQLKSLYIKSKKTDDPIKTFSEMVNSRLHCFILRHNSKTSSPFMINQMIRHGNVIVNGIKTPYKSFQLKDGDNVEFMGETLVYQRDMEFRNPMPYTPDYQLIIDFFRR